MLLRNGDVVDRVRSDVQSNKQQTIPAAVVVAATAAHRIVIAEENKIKIYFY